MLMSLQYVAKTTKIQSRKHWFLQQKSHRSMVYKFCFAVLSRIILCFQIQFKFSMALLIIVTAVIFCCHCLSGQQTAKQYFFLCQLNLIGTRTENAASFKEQEWKRGWERKTNRVTEAVRKWGRLMMRGGRWGWRGLSFVSSYSSVGVSVHERQNRRKRKRTEEYSR